MRNFHLAAIGDNCIDKFLSLGIGRVGGNALNVSVHFSKLGNRSIYFGAVGDDEEGRWTREALVSNGVDDTYLLVRPEVTAYTDIEHSDNGDRRFVFEEFGASGEYFPSDQAISSLSTVNHLHFGMLNGSARVCSLLSERGPSLSVDCAVNDVDYPMEVAFGSVGEDEDKARYEMQRLLAKGHRLVVVTRGAKGAIASDGENGWDVPGKPIVPIDTTGAGDAFIAGFISDWKLNDDVPRALQAATQNAAATCLHIGGFEQGEHTITLKP